MSEQPSSIPPMPGCECVWLDLDLVDTTECSMHPLSCDAIHPLTGVGCHHGPGHPGLHAYMECHQWPNTEDGDPTWQGADMSPNRLLEFLSGYDPGMCVPVLNQYDTELHDLCEYPGGLYSERDLIRALIAEVHRLRSEAAGGDS